MTKSLTRDMELFQHLKTIEQHCPCGARPESLNSHPHVSGCPVEMALRLLTKGGDEICSTLLDANVNCANPKLDSQAAEETKAAKDFELTGKKYISISEMLKDSGHTQDYIDYVHNLALEADAQQILQLQQSLAEAKKEVGRLANLLTEQAANWSKTQDQLTSARNALVMAREAITNVITACKSEPSMNNQKYDNVGIECNKSLSAIEKELGKQSPP